MGAFSAPFSSGPGRGASTSAVGTATLGGVSLAWGRGADSAGERILGAGRAPEVPGMGRVAGAAWGAWAGVWTRTAGPSGTGVGREAEAGGGGGVSTTRGTKGFGGGGSARATGAGGGAWASSWEEAGAWASSWAGASACGLASSWEARGGIGGASMTCVEGTGVGASATWAGR